jgi:hypothetical protein
VADGNRIVDEAAGEAAADRSAFTGAGMLADAVALGEKVRGGEWTEGLLSLASAGYEAHEFLADPIAKLAGMGLGWAIEFFDPIRWLLDQLTGDQQRLATMAGTWSGIATELHGAASDLHDRYTKDTAGWTGPAVAQYRLFCADRVDLYHAAGAAAQSTADNVEFSRGILSVVREIVRGLVTDAVGEAISIVCRYPPPATPAAAGEVSLVVVRTGNRIQEWLDKLRRAFANAAQLMKDGGKLFGDIKDALAHANQLGRMSMGAGRHLQFLGAVPADLGKGLLQAAKHAAKEMPANLAEKTAVEFGKEAVAGAAKASERQDEPGDPSRLYDGPGPYRVTGTLE